MYFPFSSSSSSFFFLLFWFYTYYQPKNGKKEAKKKKKYFYPKANKTCFVQRFYVICSLYSYYLMGIMFCATAAYTPQLYYFIVHINIYKSRLTVTNTHIYIQRKACLIFWLKLFMNALVFLVIQYISQSYIYSQCHCRPQIAETDTLYIYLYSYTSCGTVNTEPGYIIN